MLTDTVSSFLRSLIVCALLFSFCIPLTGAVVIKMSYNLFAVSIESSKKSSKHGKKCEWVSWSRWSDEMERRPNNVSYVQIWQRLCTNELFGSFAFVGFSYTTPFYLSRSSSLCILPTERELHNWVNYTLFLENKSNESFLLRGLYLTACFQVPFIFPFVSVIVKSSAFATLFLCCC